MMALLNKSDLGMSLDSHARFQDTCFRHLFASYQILNPDHRSHTASVNPEQLFLPNSSPFPLSSDGLICCPFPISSVSRWFATARFDGLHLVTRAFSGRDKRADFLTPQFNKPGSWRRLPMCPEVCRISPGRSVTLFSDRSANECPARCNFRQTTAFFAVDLDFMESIALTQVVPLKDINIPNWYNPCRSGTFIGAKMAKPAIVSPAQMARSKLGPSSWRKVLPTHRTW